jgi:hypothetical protein
MNKIAEISSGILGAPNAGLAQQEGMRYGYIEGFVTAAPLAHLCVGSPDQLPLGF